jgi:quinoprotein glucose dehydrogenase
MQINLNYSSVNLPRFLAGLIVLVVLVSCTNKKEPYTSWEIFGGSKENIHYTTLNEIDSLNVNRLQVAWTYHCGDADTASHSLIQCNPIIIGDILYGLTPKMKLFALNAANGRQIWIFNPFDGMDDVKRNNIQINNGRGICYWSDDAEDKRIYYTVGSNLYCINAKNGKPVNSFGNQGMVDLHNGLGRDVNDLYITANSPGIIYKDLIIMGSRVSEGSDAAPGHIRAYDTRTGQQKWIFHTIPYPGEPGFDTWEDSVAYKNIGGANAWSGFSLDEKRGILFASTGSAAPDFYGGTRKGANLFADCLLALDAATGKRIWHFQDIHHDVWDKDLPCAPALVTVMHGGKQTDAVAQPTKTGFVFVFERETGKPLFPIHEKEVPVNSTLTGEKLSPTQPFPSLPKPFVRQVFNVSDINDLIPDSSIEDIKKRLLSYKAGNMFEPPSKQGTVIFPGYDGGAEWGGPGFDPGTGWLYVNANEMPWVLTIIDVKNKSGKKENYLEAGKRLYMQNCMNCHGPERKGSGNYPSLLEANKKFSEARFTALVTTGRRMMPGFRQLSNQEKSAIASFVLSIKSTQQKPFVETSRPVDTFRNVAYSMTGYNKFLSREGYPAIKPPWGTLNAINLNTGNLEWKIPLGEFSGFKEKGIITGTENYGGPIVTKNGLLFIAATLDGKFRVFNKYNGKLLWETLLPAAGFATPSVYAVNGKQYIVLACGGGKLGTKSGDSYIAFALP